MADSEISKLASASGTDPRTRWTYDILKAVTEQWTEEWSKNPENAEEFQKLLRNSPEIFPTPRIVAQRMVRLAEIWQPQGNVYDPCMGMGEFLIEAKKLGHPVYGTDKMQKWRDAYQFAKTNLALNGIGEDRFQFDVELTERGRNHNDFRIVVSNPPIGWKNRDLHYWIGKTAYYDAGVVVLALDEKTLQRFFEKRSKTYEEFVSRKKDDPEYYDPECLFVIEIEKESLWRLFWSSIQLYLFGFRKIFSSQIPQESWENRCRRKVLYATLSESENDFAEIDRFLRSDEPEREEAAKELKRPFVGYSEWRPVREAFAWTPIAIRPTSEILRDIGHSNAVIFSNFQKLSRDFGHGWTPDSAITVSQAVEEVCGKHKISNRSAYRIITALQSTNLLILAGPSGVWKSSIVKTLAETLSERPATDDPKHSSFFKFPVKSGFSDETGLLGYWNPLLSKYEGTEVLAFLMNAASDTDVPRFLLLDEMNLSRIENYFSEILVQLDDLKDGKPISVRLFQTVVDTEAKWRNFSALRDSIEAENENFSISRLTKLGGVQKLSEGECSIFWERWGDESFLVSMYVRIFPNLHIIGTVNEDETTHSISNKVLDRAFYVPMWVEGLFEEAGWEGADDFAKWFQESVADFSENEIPHMGFGRKAGPKFEAFVHQRLEAYGNVESPSTNRNALYDFRQVWSVRRKRIEVMYEIKGGQLDRQSVSDRLKTLENSRPRDYDTIRIFVCPNESFTGLENGVAFIELSKIEAFLRKLADHYGFHSYNERKIKEMSRYKHGEYRTFGVRADWYQRFGRRALKPDTTVADYFSKLNGKLSRISPQCLVGYRSMRDIAYFCETYLSWLRPHENGLVEALDHAIVMKIVPKIQSVASFSNEESRHWIEELERLLREASMVESAKTIHALLTLTQE